MIPIFNDMFVQIQNKILESYPESKLDYRHFKRENFYEIRYYNKYLIDNQVFQKFIYEECNVWLNEKGITNYCINYRTKKIKPRKLKIVNSVSDFGKIVNQIKIEISKLYPHITINYCYEEDNDVFEISYKKLKPEDYFNSFMLDFDKLCETLLFNDRIENFYHTNKSEMPSFEDIFNQIKIEFNKSYPNTEIGYGISEENMIKTYEIRYYDTNLRNDIKFQQKLREILSSLDKTPYYKYRIEFFSKIARMSESMIDERIKYLTDKLNNPVFDSGETIEVLKSQYDYLCEQVNFIDNRLHKLAHEFEPKVKLLIKSKGDTLQLKAEITQIYEKVCLLVSAENPKRMTFDNLYNRYVR